MSIGIAGVLRFFKMVTSFPDEFLFERSDQFGAIGRLGHAAITRATFIRDGDPQR
jgi:hypothetical protein